MSLEYVQKFSVFSVVLECIEMHCFDEMSVFVTVSKGSLVSFYCAKVSEAWASNFEAYVTSSLCFPLVFTWLGWLGGCLIGVVSPSSWVHWWLLLWSLARSPSGILGVILVGLLVSLVIGGSLALGLHISDSSCVHGESAMTSAGVSDASDPDSSSLDTGRGMDRKLRVSHVGSSRLFHCMWWGVLAVMCIMLSSRCTLESWGHCQTLWVSHVAKQGFQLQLPLVLQVGSVLTEVVKVLWVAQECYKHWGRD